MATVVHVDTGPGDQQADTLVHANLCERLSGWNLESIGKLVHHQNVPDKWWQDPTPSLAFLETLRSFLNDAGLSYRHVLPKIMDALQLQTPHHIGNFLRKIKTQSSKAMAGYYPVTE